MMHKNIISMAVVVALTGCVTQHEFTKLVECASYSTDKFADNMVSRLPVFSYDALVRRCEKKKKGVGRSSSFLRSGQSISYFLGITPVIVQAGEKMRVMTCFEVRSDRVERVSEKLYLAKEGGEKIQLSHETVNRKDGIWLVETDIRVPKKIDAGTYRMMMDIRYADKVLKAEEVFEISKSDMMIRQKCGSKD